MIKKYLVILLLIFTILLTTSCKGKKPKSLILFNHFPITKENFLENSTTFKTNERIYFIYMTQKDIATEDLRIKIFKRNEKAGYSMGDAVYSNNFRLKKGEVNFFTDYIVIHSPGYYVMHVYRMNRLWEADARADFKVDER